MSTRVVRTQSELDSAIQDGVRIVEVRSERGVWISVRACGSSSVRAYGSSSVTACGSSSVRAYGSSSVTAYDSSSVTACDSSSVTAYDSSSVRACDSSSVTACDSSSVRACDSSSVRACDSSSVRACDSSSVTAGSHTAVHLHSGNVTLDGGVVIDHTAVDKADPKTWCDYYGVTVTDGIATVYKALNDRWTTERGIDYSPGTLPSCADFKATDECGAGLHFGPTPVHALAYHNGATKFVSAGVRLDEMQIITGSTAKCKVPRVVTACAEVDVHGRVPAVTA